MMLSIFAIDAFHGCNLWPPLSPTTTARALPISLSSALIYAGVPDHPEGHDMIVKSVRVFAP
jgi:hypothetical protein